VHILLLERRSIGSENIFEPIGNGWTRVGRRENGEVMFKSCQALVQVCGTRDIHKTRWRLNKTDKRKRKMKRMNHAVASNVLKCEVLRVFEYVFECFWVLSFFIAYETTSSGSSNRTGKGNEICRIAIGSELAIVEVKAVLM
jgi:hypothetical protein